MALVFKKFEMDFRSYLRKHRDPIVLPKILELVIEGLEQLHYLGYVHRDLKPENTVLNLHPLEVRIIDFIIAYPSF